MTNTQNEQSSNLLKEYLDGKYEQINSSCSESTGKITKGLAKLAEISEE